VSYGGGIDFILLTGGEHHMEYEQQQPNPDDGFMNRIKESPRTVSAVIIVLIVAAAIYAFSGNKQNNNEELAGDMTVSPSPEASVTPTPDAKATVAPKTSTAPRATVVPAKPVDKTALMEASKKLASGKIENNTYIETAQKGEGMTHLARRAATRYLADHEAGYTLTNEHRIYIEDYIRKQMQKHPVTVGAQETISFDLVKQAVEAAGKLSAPQLKNLTKYTHALT
jgi:hypothetical protein